MAVQLDVLKKLQMLDLELYQLRQQQEQKPLALEEANAQVAEEEVKTKEVEERFIKLQVEHKEKEIELQACEDQVRKLQGQLFQLKTNKEYTTMQKEIGGTKADNSLLEENILEMLDAIDRVSDERTAQKKQYQEKQAWLEIEKKRIENELSVIEDKVNQLQKDRDQLVKEIDPESLTVYERVLSTREGVALVQITNESCGGCHRKLPPQVVNQVYLRADLVTCENCNRILYSDEHTVDA